MKYFSFSNKSKWRLTTEMILWSIVCMYVCVARSGCGCLLFTKHSRKSGTKLKLCLYYFYRQCMYIIRIYVRICIWLYNLSFENHEKWRFVAIIAANVDEKLQSLQKLLLILLRWRWQWRWRWRWWWSWWWLCWCCWYTVKQNTDTKFSTLDRPFGGQ